MNVLLTLTSTTLRLTPNSSDTFQIISNRKQQQNIRIKSSAEKNRAGSQKKKLLRKEFCQFHTIK